MILIRSTLSLQRGYMMGPFFLGLLTFFLFCKILFCYITRLKKKEKSSYFQKLRKSPPDLLCWGQRGVCLWSQYITSAEPTATEVMVWIRYMRGQQFLKLWSNGQTDGSSKQQKETFIEFIQLPFQVKKDRFRIVLVEIKLYKNSHQ